MAIKKANSFDNIDKLSEIWALWIILWYIFTGLALFLLFLFFKVTNLNSEHFHSLNLLETIFETGIASICWPILILFLGGEIQLNILILLSITALSSFLVIFFLNKRNYFG